VYLLQLQSRFNLDTFKTETDVLVTEGVSVPGVLSCPDNSLLVSLLECRRSGIFAVIDEVVRTPGRENKYKDSLLSGAFEARFGSSHFIKTIANSKSFTVMHYAGSVSYSVSGFCERSVIFSICFSLYLQSNARPRDARQVHGLSVTGPRADPRSKHGSRRFGPGLGHYSWQHDCRAIRHAWSAIRRLHERVDVETQRHLRTLHTLHQAQLVESA
jgi:hypothetical protein